MGLLPKAVRDGEERANQLIQDYAKERKGTPPTPESSEQQAAAPEMEDNSQVFLEG